MDNLIFTGKKYFYPSINSKKYTVYVSDNVNKIKSMIDYFNQYSNQASDPNEYMIGIDFEFNNINNKREIALFQINLETKEKETRIYLFYPPMLNSKQISSVKSLLINNKITVILHGGESLDIPYLFDNIITTEKEQISFCQNLIDTKYLCEYYHLENNKEDSRCKIYYILEKMKLINKKQFNI